MLGCEVTTFVPIVPRLPSLSSPQSHKRCGQHPGDGRSILRFLFPPPNPSRQVSRGAAPPPPPPPPSPPRPRAAPLLVRDPSLRGDRCSRVLEAPRRNGEQQDVTGIDEAAPGPVSLEKQAFALISSVAIEVVRLSDDIFIVTLPTTCLMVCLSHGT
ncbi:hypothetical protein EJB05_17064, partial [Eragrostis curvula]